MNIWVKTLSGIFFVLVVSQALYCGIKFGHWWGLATLCMGIVFGLIYSEIKNKGSNESISK